MYYGILYFLLFRDILNVLFYIILFIAETFLFTYSFLFYFFFIKIYINSY